MSDRLAYVYALHDPRTDEVRYVGRSVDPDARLSGHRHAANTPTPNACQAWIQELAAVGLSPRMETLMVVPESIVADAEGLAVFTHQHCDLLNTARTPEPVDRGDYQERALALRKRLAVLRVTHGFRQTHLAERMGLHPSLITYALRGRREQHDRLDAIEAVIRQVESELPA